MGRILFFALVAVFVYWVIRSYRRSLQRRQDELHGAASPEKGEDMVRCAHCGVHLPRSESIAAKGDFFCNDEHRRLYLEP